MEQLDATVLSTALPSMAPTFGVSPADLSIALTAYLLSLAVFIPASGYIADRLGPRRVYLVGMFTFLCGSGLCAQASTLPTLVFARLIQGAGGATMLPVGRLLLLYNISKKDIIAAMGWLLTPGLTGQILGPTVGGLIVTYLNWRWIFYLNFPIGAAALILTYRFIVDRPRQLVGPFDLKGFALCGTALSCLLFGFETIGRGHETRLLPLLLLLIGATCGLGYVCHSGRLTDRPPLLDLTLMRISTFRLAIVAGSLTRITQGALPFLLPLMMQSGLGLAPAESGFLTFSMACGFVAMKPLASLILGKFSIRSTLIYNSVLSSVLCAICSGFRIGWPHWLILLILFLAGLSLSLQITGYNIICFEDIPSSRTAAANSFFGTFQQVMLSIGICVASISLNVSRMFSGNSLLSPTGFSFAILVVTGISLSATYWNAKLQGDCGNK